MEGLAEHTKGTDPMGRHDKQLLLPRNAERSQSFAEIIRRFFATGLISLNNYSDWLTKPLLVLKRNNTQRMCIDYNSPKTYN